MSDHAVAVLGAGFSGLAAAQRLSEQGQEVAVFERYPYSGGHAASHETRGYIFDEGPHVSFTTRPEIQRLFAEAVGDRFIEHKATLLNLWREHWVRHPVQCNLHGLPTDVVGSAILDFLEVDGKPAQGTQNYAEWCLQGLGRTLCEQFVFQYTRKYWTTDAARMSTDWVGPRMYPPSRADVIRGALAPSGADHHYLTTFRYPTTGGFAAYLQAVARDTAVRHGKEVIAIDPQRHRIDFADGDSSYYEQLVSSLPMPELVRMISDVPVAVREAAGKLACTSLVLVNVGLPRTEGYPDAHWMYFYDEDVSFSRGHLPHRLSPNNVPAGSGSMQLEIYHSPMRPLPTVDVVGKCMEDLERTGLVEKGEPIDLLLRQDVKYANVLFDLDRQASVTIVRRYLAEVNIEVCGRYGEWEYQWTDDAIISGWKAASRVLSMRQPA